VFSHAGTGNPLVRLLAASPRPCTAGIFPVPAPARAMVSFTLAPVPALLAVVPMDIDRTWVCAFPCNCFQCGAARHLARECPVTSDVRHTDVLNEVVRQLGDNLLDELFARLTTSASLPAESADENTDPAGFHPMAK
jgi:hypothetical protein